MVAVGHQELGLLERLGDDLLLVRVADRPDPVLLSRVVDVLLVGCPRPHLPADLTDLGGAAVDQQDRCGVQLHGGHPPGELGHLLRVDALVGEDLALLGCAREVGEVEAADDPAHGQTGVGVLMYVERRFVVPAGQPSPLPGGQTLGDAAIGSREGACRGRVTDPPWSQGQSPEGRQLQRAGHGRRHRGWSGVHRCIVG